LRLADADAYARLDATAHRLRQLVTEALDAQGVPHVVQDAGNLFGVFLGPTEPVRDFAAAQQQDLHRFRDFFHVMLDHGVYLPPSAYEAWFVSTAHDDAALDRIHAALPVAAKAAAAAQRDSAPPSEG
jgi:glutamate-1-semialdehyde 2,1-aminomutase